MLSTFPSQIAGLCLFFQLHQCCFSVLAEIIHMMAGLPFRWKHHEGSSKELSAFAEKAGRLFFPRPYQLSVLYYLAGFFLDSERGKNSCWVQRLHSAFRPCCTRQCTNKYQQSPCLWVLTHFSLTAFVFALQVQVWETAVEYCKVFLMLGLLFFFFFLGRMLASDNWVLEKYKRKAEES